MSEPWLEGLNPAQREAVTHGDGPLLIIAGAGTGKTRTLACRVARLVHQGVSPDRILLLTFTRRASAEMLTRADHMSGRRASSRIWGGTFHAVANRLLRVYGRSLGMLPDFTVLDQADAADVMNLVRSELGLARQKKRFARKQTLVAIYSRLVNSQDKLSRVLRRHFPSVTVAEESLVEEYRSLLELLNTIKYAGTRGSGLEGVALTKALLNDLEAEYRRRCGSILATYQIFYCRGHKQEAKHI